MRCSKFSHSKLAVGSAVSYRRSYYYYYCYHHHHHYHYYYYYYHHHTYTTTYPLPGALQALMAHSLRPEAAPQEVSIADSMCA